MYAHKYGLNAKHYNAMTFHPSISWHPSGKDPWNQWTTYTDFAAVRTNYWFVWTEGNWPPDWAWFLPRFFSPFCHRWSFRSLPLSPLACLVGDTSFPAQSLTWLHRYYLNWTKLDNAITKFNNEMHSADNWVLNPVILNYWHNLPILILCSALLQFVLLKALYK